MIEFLIIFSAFALVMIAMAVGVLMGRAPIKGSCGGLGAVGVERACDCVDVCKNEAKAESGTATSKPKKYQP